MNQSPTPLMVLSTKAPIQGKSLFALADAVPLPNNPFAWPFDLAQ